MPQEEHVQETISGIHIPNKPPGTSWDITTSSSSIHSIQTHQCPSSTACKHNLLLPSLCHPHIHLDKPFLLSSSTGTKYADLTPQSGTFPEALKNTAAAKARFDPDDLYLRGSWLIDESIAAGVTAMRAFVEVDETVGMMCVETGIRLKKEYSGRCAVQLCAFAQDPIFSGDHGEGNRRLLEETSKLEEVEALGTTPYVEYGPENGKKNIKWAVEKALQLGRHLDFHLDYNLNQDSEAMIWKVIHELTAMEWSSKTSKAIAIGHCTRMTLFSDAEMAKLSQAIHEAKLPLSFVGLPSSDLYMMGRPQDDTTIPGQRPRGTLQVPMLISKYRLNGAIGVNNVGNAFTPYGPLDPLRLACLGVGLYHAGTPEDAKLLYECVSTRARRAIGLPTTSSLGIDQGHAVDFMVVETQPRVKYSSSVARLQTTVEEMVWDPPSTERRTLYFRPEL